MLGRHDGGALLAEADAVAPSAAVEEERAGLLGDFEPGAGDLVPAESGADGEAEILGGDFVRIKMDS